MFSLENKKTLKTSKLLEKSIVLHCVDLGLSMPVYHNVLHGMQVKIGLYLATVSYISVCCRLVNTK